MFTIPPRDGSPRNRTSSTVDEAVADIEGKLPGLLRYMDPSDPGMHATDTIDFEVVLEGTVVLELDDGAEVTLQRRRHRRAERNAAPVEEPCDKPARMALFVCGASHAKVPAAD